MEREKMIKLSEFAKQFGVSDRHARRLISDFTSELSGHIERRGNGGTWIDEVAVEILRSRLRNPVEMLPSPSEDPDSGMLQGKIQELQADLVQAYRALSEERSARVGLLEELGQQRLLAARTESERERADRAEERAAQAAADLARAKEDARAAEDIAQLSAQETELYRREKMAAEARAAASDEELARVRAELEAVKKRGLWARIWNKEVHP